MTMKKMKCSGLVIFIFISMATAAAQALGIMSIPIMMVDKVRADPEEQQHEQQQQELQFVDEEDPDSEDYFYYNYNEEQSYVDEDSTSQRGTQQERDATPSQSEASPTTTRYRSGNSRNRDAEVKGQMGKHGNDDASEVEKTGGDKPKADDSPSHRPSETPAIPQNKPPVIPTVPQSRPLGPVKKPASLPPLKEIHIQGGKFTMGNTRDTKLTHACIPGQEVKVKPFYIDNYVISNADYKEFVEATEYASDSEKYGWSFVLEYHATSFARAITNQTVKDATHWLATPGATWEFPDGPFAPEGTPSSFDILPEYPATHLSYNDADAYCRWRGKRLPTESEWEYAARGGLKQKLYPWGDADAKKPAWRFNIWQGEFPKENTQEDGYSSTAPVWAFEPNPFGLFNTVGNIWEWCDTPFVGEEGQRVLRGASYLDSFDGKFNHPATLNARMGNTEDSASSNTGARCARTPKNAAAKGKASSSSTSYNEVYQYPKPKPRMDQEFLSKLVEKGGVEALQEHLGDNAQVMTPKQLREQKEKLERQRDELEKMKDQFESEDNENNMQKQQQQQQQQQQQKQKQQKSNKRPKDEL